MKIYEIFYIFRILKNFHLIFHILYYDTRHIEQETFEHMSLSIRDYTIIKVVQASHYQGDVKYGASRGIQCSCILLISVCWTLFKSADLWNNFDLDCVLGKGNQLFKYIVKFRNLGAEGLPQEFMTENCLINVELLENKT